jgi:hypothetical protein
MIVHQIGQLRTSVSEMNDILELIQNFLPMYFGEEGDRFPGPFVYDHLGFQAHREIRIDHMMLEGGGASGRDEHGLYPFFKMCIPYCSVLASDRHGCGGDQVGDIPIFAKLVNPLLNWCDFKPTYLLGQREVLEIQRSETGVGQVFRQDPMS